MERSETETHEISADTPVPVLKEPHVKHFSIKRYSRFYELRERSKVCVRIVFTMSGGDILLLAPFIKRERRDTMQALELSLKMLEDTTDNLITLVTCVMNQPDYRWCVQARQTW